MVEANDVRQVDEFQEHQSRQLFGLWRIQTQFSQVTPWLNKVVNVEGLNQAQDGLADVHRYSRVTSVTAELLIHDCRDQQNISPSRQNTLMPLIKR